MCECLSVGAVKYLPRKVVKVVQGDRIYMLRQSSRPMRIRTTDGLARTETTTE